MVRWVCCTALLLGASVGPPAGMPPPDDQEVLLSAGGALVGLDRLDVVLSLRGAEPDMRRLNAAKLKTQMVEKLDAAGIRQGQTGSGSAANLVVRIEATPVLNGGMYVCRVQVAVNRPVVLPGPRNLHVPAEVWQGRPVLEVVARGVLAEAVSAAVSRQVGLFIEIWRAARSPAAPPPREGEGVLPPSETGPVPIDSGGPAPTAAYPFVSSRNSQVFHRPDCRWAQNIASGNLVGYRSRDEAVQAGKRPCKTCEP
jgi:hypothetical protein